MFQIQSRTPDGEWTDVDGLLYIAEYLALRGIQILNEIAATNGTQVEYRAVAV